MKKTAQERSAFNKAKQFVNVKRHLTRMLDSKYKKLSDNTETLDTLVRQTLSGTKSKIGFVRKVKLARSAFNRDNYLGCGVEMTDAVKMLTDAKVYLDKANMDLAGTFHEMAKSRYEESGGTKEDLYRTIKNIHTFSLDIKASLIKEAGIIDWMDNLKTDIGDAAHKMSNFSLWKKLFSKNEPIIKATETIVAELEAMSNIVINSLGEMAQELASGNMEDYYVISAKLGKEITSFSAKFKAYMGQFYEPLLSKLGEKQEIESTAAVAAIKGEKEDSDLIRNLESLKINDIRSLDYKELLWLSRVLGKNKNKPELRNIISTVDRIKFDKNEVFQDTFDKLVNQPELINSAPLDFMLYLGYRALNQLKYLPPDILELLVTRLDIVKVKASGETLKNLEKVKSLLMEILMNKSDAKVVASSMKFSHIKDGDLSDKISSALAKGKVSQALKVLDYEMALVKEEKKKHYILNCFRDRIQDLDK